MHPASSAFIHSGYFYSVF